MIRMMLMTGWCGGAIGRATELPFTGHGFDSWLHAIAQWPWASYLHLRVRLSSKQYNLVLSKGGMIFLAGKICTVYKSFSCLLTLHGCMPVIVLSVI